MPGQGMGRRDPSTTIITRDHQGHNINTVVIKGTIV